VIRSANKKAPDCSGAKGVEKRYIRPFLRSNQQRVTLGPPVSTGHQLANTKWPAPHGLRPFIKIGFGRRVRNRQLCPSGEWLPAARDPQIDSIGLTLYV